MTSFEDLGLPKVRLPSVGEALAGETVERRRDPWTVVEFWRSEGDFRLAVRLMPDADAENPRWWRDIVRWVIPFRGTVNEPDRPVVALLSSPSMWGEEDPLRPELADLSARGEEYHQLARMLRPRVSAAVYGLVRRAEGLDVPPPEPWHVLLLPFSARRAMVSSARELGEDACPVDPVAGHDFVLVRRMKDGRADFSASAFHPRPRALNEKEIEHVRTHGWLDLSRVAGTPPSPELVRGMTTIFSEAMAGGLLDPERWPGLRWREAYGSEVAILRAISKLNRGGRSGAPRAADDVPPPSRRRPAPPPEPETEVTAPAGGTDRVVEEEDDPFATIGGGDDPLALLRRRISEGGGP